MRHLRNWLGLSALLLFLFSSLSLAQPKAVFPETEFDFGLVPQNSKVTHDFWIKNEGTDTLRIIRVKPG